MGDLLLVMSKAKQGREVDYLCWYRTRHLPDMMQVDGVADGRLYAIAEPNAEARWSVAARYFLTKAAATVFADISARAYGDDMPPTDAIDGERVLMLGACPIGPRRLAQDGTDRTDGLIFIVLTNATAGDDDVFNAWYSDRHIPDVLAIPGFIAAQRFKVASETAGKTSPWRYLALYEVAPEHREASMAELQSRAGGEKMPLSPTLSNDVYATLFAPVT